MQSLPGMLSGIAGVRVDEYDPIGGETHLIVDDQGNTYECSQWCDLLTPTTAEPIAWYGDDYYVGIPAVTVNIFGKGEIYYVGTHAEESYWSELLGNLAEEHELYRFPGLPDGVQASVRTGTNGTLPVLAYLGPPIANHPVTVRI